MKEMAKKQISITWHIISVDVKKIKPTPTNYKIKSDLGRERLTQSLELFGLAGSVVCNTDLTLIDGNSRVEQAKERGIKKLNVSIPNRKLTPKEYREMSAMYDFAKAGEVDIDRIKGDIGTTEDFFTKWGLQVPPGLLEKLGAKAGTVIVGKGKKGANGKAEQGEPVAKPTEMLVNLFFTEKQEAEFRKMEQVLLKRLKTVGTSDTVFKAFKFLCK